MFGLMKPALCRADKESKNEYRLHYCGTCKTMGSLYSQKSRFTLNNDIVFLGELLTNLSGEINIIKSWSPAYHSYNCLSLPSLKEDLPLSLKFVSTLNIILAQLKIEDNIIDTKNKGKYLWKIAARFFNSEFNKATQQMKEWGISVQEIIKQISGQTKREEKQVHFDSSKEYLDFYAEPTAMITASSFKYGVNVIEKKELSENMYNLGYYFGKLVYLIDAFEDIQKDYKNKSFNAITKAFKTDGDSISEPIQQEMNNIFNGLKAEITHFINLLPLTEKKKTYFNKMLSFNLTKRLKLCNSSNLSNICQMSENSAEDNPIDLSKPSDKNKFRNNKKKDNNKKQNKKSDSDNNCCLDCCNCCNLPGDCCECFNFLKCCKHGDCPCDSCCCGCDCPG